MKYSISASQLLISLKVLSLLNLTQYVAVTLSTLVSSRMMTEASMFISVEYGADSSRDTVTMLHSKYHTFLTLTNLHSAHALQR